MPGFLLGQFYHFFITSRDNSVSVYHYCSPCIKSVSWIHGKTSKTDRR